MTAMLVASHMHLHHFYSEEWGGTDETVLVDEDAVSYLEVVAVEQRHALQKDEEVPGGGFQV